MTKSIHIVSIEAIVVGLCLVILTYIVKSIGVRNVFSATFISGALFHLIFEISGLNLKYSLDYCKIFEKS